MTADQYPYIASSTSLAAMVVPDWALQGTTADFVRIAADRDRGTELRAGIEQQLLERDGGASIRIARYPPRPDWAGLDLATIASREGTTPLEIVLEIQRKGGAQAISFGMSEDDVREVMRQRVRRHGVRRLDPRRRPRRAAPTLARTAPFRARSATPSTTRS